MSTLNPAALGPWLQVLQGLLTPVIGVTTLYIAWQQWKANQFKLVLEQYERRLRVYQEVIAILTLILRDFKPEFSDLQKFRSATAEADFLFGPEISAYVAEIVKRGLTLRQANSEYRDLTQVPPLGYDHNKVVATMHVQETWFLEQFNEAKNKFNKYLNISNL